MRRTILVFLTSLLAIGLFLTGCGSDKAKEETLGENVNQAGDKNQKIVIYTTLYPYYDFAKKIAGDSAVVENLVPPGVEPHDFEPSAKDMVKLSEANILIYNGAGYEAWVEKAVGAIENKKLIVIEASKNIELLNHEEHGEDRHEEEQDHGAFDPHFWLDPQKAKKAAESIKDGLAQADPDKKKLYEDNYAALASQFDQLDAEFKDMVTHAGKKEIIVSHSAFGYLAHAYGLEQISISGISPSDEPTQQELKHIIEQAKEHQINYILFETLVSGKVAEVVKNEVGAEALTLNPLENLTQDELSQGKDYFSVMRENIETLKKALEYSK